MGREHNGKTTKYFVQPKRFERLSVLFSAISDLAGKLAFGSQADLFI